MFTMYGALDTEGLIMLNKIKLAGTALLVCVSSEMALAKEEPTTFSACHNARDVQINDLFVGWGRTAGRECPDAGNCISFRYSAQGGSPRLGFVHFQMNLNDGDKGKAMFDILKTAQENRFLVDLYGHANECPQNIFHGAEIKTR